MTIETTKKRTSSRAPFELKAPFPPKGDQGRAIKELTEGLENGTRHQVLLGVTGSGAGAFTLGALGDTDLAVGESTTFSVTFDPDADQGYTATISFDTNITTLFI